MWKLIAVCFVSSCVIEVPAKHHSLHTKKSSVMVRKDDPPQIFPPLPFKSAGLFTGRFVTSLATFTLYKGPNMEEVEKIEGNKSVVFKKLTLDYPVVFIVNGIRMDKNYRKEFQKAFIEAFRGKKVNLINVNWRYTTFPILAAIEVGYRLIDVINNIRENSDILNHPITIYAHNYGAIAAATVGNYLDDPKISRIVGLDVPLRMNYLDSRLRLSKNSAEVVEVFHCDIDYGTISSAFGHRDFYPNGGHLNKVLKGFPTDACYILVADAIEKPDKNYAAFLCGNWSKFLASRCFRTKLRIYNDINVDEVAQGSYYFRVEHL